MAVNRDESPMNPVLRARLGLPEESRFRVKALRGLLKSLDTVSQALVGRYFFGLRDSEELMSQLEGLSGTDMVDALLQSRGGTTLSTTGLDHVPAYGPVVISATHPTGMFDYVAHAGALRDKRPDLKVVATTEASHFLHSDVLVPVAADTGPIGSRAAVMGMKGHLENGGALLVFGSGRVSHRSGQYLVEPDWRMGATRVSQMCDAPLVPAALNTRNTQYYYRMRSLAQTLSGGNEQTGAMFGSVRHIAEFMDKLGGTYDIAYGARLAPGTAPAVLQSRAEGLFPGLYRSAA